MSSNDSKGAGQAAPRMRVGAQPPAPPASSKDEGLKVPRFGQDDDGPAVASEAIEHDEGAAPATADRDRPVTQRQLDAFMSDIQRTIAAAMAGMQRTAAPQFTDAQTLEHGIREKILDIPVDGRLEDLERTDLELEVHHDAEHYIRVKKQALAFNEQLLLIMVHESASENEQAVVPVGVNGRMIYITRGMPMLVRRKYVERLARAINESIDVKACKDADGEPVNRTTKKRALAYPFQVLRDPHPQGAQWLRQILNEG